MAISDLFVELESLKKERGAVILAHYYQDPDIQDSSDYIGDCLALAQQATMVEADVILFCGVHFMCETVKILNPEKQVLLPDINVGYSLADSAPEDKFRAWINSHPNHIVISYINCTAKVKAMSDIICTLSNAEKIINSLPREKKSFLLQISTWELICSKKLGGNCFYGTVLAKYIKFFLKKN